MTFFFSGLHTDYHKPSDTADKINAAGAVKVLSLVYGMMDEIADEPQRLAYVEVKTAGNLRPRRRAEATGPFSGRSGFP